MDTRAQRTHSSPNLEKLNIQFTLTPRLAHSGANRAAAPNSVVQTGVKSSGCENKIAQDSFFHSYNVRSPCVVGAVKLGAREPSRSTEELVIFFEAKGSAQTVNEGRIDSGSEADAYPKFKVKIKIFHIMISTVSTTGLFELLSLLLHLMLHIQDTLKFKNIYYEAFILTV